MLLRPLPGSYAKLANAENQSLTALADSGEAMTAENSLVRLLPLSVLVASQCSRVLPDKVAVSSSKRHNGWHRIYVSYVVRECTYESFEQIGTQHRNAQLELLSIEGLGRFVEHRGTVLLHLDIDYSMTCIAYDMPRIARQIW